jgi:hypothetical protein
MFAWPFRMAILVIKRFGMVSSDIVASHDLFILHFGFHLLSCICQTAIIILTQQKLIHFHILKFRNFKSESVSFGWYLCQTSQNSSVSAI